MRISARAIATTVAFTALSVVLSRAVSGISIPAPYFPFLAYEIWEIPIIVAFFLFGPRYAVAITLLSGSFLFAVFLNYTVFGGILACLSMLLGVYLAGRFISRRTAHGEPWSEKKAIVLYTALAILFRSVNLAVWDYAMLRYPLPLGLGLSEPVIRAILLPITIFNATEPLYPIPIGYFVARKVGSALKLTKKSETGRARNGRGLSVAGGEGFEPSTPNLGGWCSIRTELLAQCPVC
jgi:riboflavin transporter FmnP